MQAILIIAVLIPSVVVHEVAHAWQARREGDDTAEQLGRITLNPIRHLDLFGSFIVPFVLALAPVNFIFGWAKPVPVNPAKYRSPIWGDIRVSLAGIVSNFGLAVLATLGLALVSKVIDVSGPPSSGLMETLVEMAQYGIIINLILAFFNLIPIPPLDGSHVLFHLLPMPIAVRYADAGRYGLLVMMGLLYLWNDLFTYLMWPVFFFLGQAYTFVDLWI
ncbi:MAG TPA: site-2 protease family protein [Gemmatimonadetes bacterium]|jgi:Zn-dependent protease|nr:site-2 protease family protein [Gemmatimonadota bacterium]